MASIAEMAARLTELHGDDPQAVGAVGGTEDDWGDLVHDAARQLDLEPDAMTDEDWEHFQGVAMECRATDMESWLAHLEAAVKR